MKNVWNAFKGGVTEALEWPGIKKSGNDNPTILRFHLN